MSLSKDFCGKRQRYVINYYKLLMEVGAFSHCKDEFWTYFNSHHVSKNRAAQIVLRKYYSTTALVDIALFKMSEWIKI